MMVLATHCMGSGRQGGNQTLIMIFQFMLALGSWLWPNYSKPMGAIVLPGWMIHSTLNDRLPPGAAAVAAKNLCTTDGRKMQQ